jgi:soluble lytic murein transglycosylase
MTLPLLQWNHWKTGQGALRLTALFTVFCLLGTPQVLTAADLTQQRQQFLAAEQALRKGDGVTYRILRDKLQNYALFPYLEYQETSPASAEKSAAFLKKYDNSPLGYDLRRRRLKLLAEKKDWKAFLADWKPTSNTAMQCVHARALVASGEKTKGFSTGARLWLHGDSLPDECDPLFEQMHKAGKLTPTLVWERIDLVRDKKSKKRTGLMKYLLRFLPKADHPWHSLWMLSLNKPEKVLASARLNRRHVSRGNLVAHSINKLAWRNHNAGLAAWHKANKKGWLNAAQKKRVELSLGKALSRRKSSRAIAFFDKVRDCRQIKGLCQLRVDHALKLRRWDRIVAWVNDMPREMQSHEKWGYWKARALQQLGRKKEAEALFKAVAGDRSYYGFMAADQVNSPYKLAHQGVPLTSVKRVAALPGFVRARELYRMGREREAGREWYWASESLDKEGLKGAARLAMQWGWDDRAIFTLLGTGYWDDLEIRFPLTHRKQVEAEARKHGIDAAWIFAIMRQESMFVPKARSPVGALGLMQLMPATARGVARKLKLATPKEADILRPELNIKLGSQYLKTLHRQFNGWEVLATPSYNAGPHRTLRWLPAKAKPVDLWIEDIPFDETRLYVQRVMSYLVLYEYRLGQKVTRLKHRIPANISKATPKQAKPKAPVSASASTAKAGKKGFLNH